MVVALGRDALTDEQRDPTAVEEQAAARPVECARGAEPLDALAQSVGDRHRPGVIPEARISARRRVVMQDQEIAHVVILLVDEGVEARALGLTEAAVGGE